MSDTATPPADPEVEVEQTLDELVETAVGGEELVQGLAPDLLAVVQGLRSGELVAVDRQQLADLTLFAGFARDRLYPLVEALAPVAHRATQLGSELQTMGPLQLVNLLTGR